MVIEDKLLYWQKRLLDLGKRNRLINCPLPKNTNRIQRHSLLINRPSINELWSIFSDSDKKLIFDLSSESCTGLETDSNHENLSVEDEDSFVKTNQTINETNKTLRSLMKKAKAFTEEKGINALYLAFGFLNWLENGNEGQEKRSPLLLVPVKLSQEDLFSPFVLSRSDEEITINHSLSQKLFNDFDIAIPEFNENAGLDSYLTSVLDIVSTLGWTINTDVVQLSLFSFLKINMYRDLEMHFDQIAAHHIIRTLNGELLGTESEFADIAEHDHDSTVPQEVFSVVDADSSQQDAILLAKKGKSFVLQGPPGTGKSQTITNIIAELMADGKRILFVSEKMAALDVVHKRLTQVGLADFCLTLHSHKTKRREILNQLEESIKLSRKKLNLQQDANNKLYKLKEIRYDLNQYDRELHTVIEPLNKSMFQVAGLLSQLQNYRNVDFVLNNCTKFTPEMLSQCQTALEELSRVVDKSGYQKANPWKGCALTRTPTHEFRQRFLVDSSALRTKIDSGLIIFKEASDIFCQSDYEWTLSDVEGVRKVFELVAQAPQIDVSWIDLDVEQSLHNIEVIERYINNINTLSKELNYKRELFKTVMTVITEDKEVCSDVSGETVSYIDFYNNSLKTRNAIRDAHQNGMLEENESKRKLDACIQTYTLEQNNYERISTEWYNTKEQLLQKYTMDLLTLDATDILSRYRTEYRSWLRSLNSLYRNDRKAMLAHFKVPEKLSYEQGLSLLNFVVKSQKLKDEFEHSGELLRSTEKLLEKMRLSHEVVTEQFNQKAVTLANAEETLTTNKIALKNHLAHSIEKVEKELATLREELPLQKSYIAIKEDLAIEITLDTNFDTLKKQLEWCHNMQKYEFTYRLGRTYINAVFEREKQTLNMTERVLKALQRWNLDIQPELDKFLDLFTEERSAEIRLSTLVNFKKYLVDCTENFSSLESLIDFRIAEERLQMLGLAEYLDKAKEINLSAEEIIPVFNKCFYRTWIDTVTSDYSALRDFRRLRQDEKVATFKKLDMDHLVISRAMLQSRLISRLPNFDISFSNGEIALLRREIAKQRKLLPTRLLIAALPNLLPALKPCLMMSPLSVSTYLGSSNYKFDVVIFDEASQVRTEDAIGAIFRAKQVIIAGDSKQLPPTDFFNSSFSNSDEYEEDEDGEADDTGAYESLLDEAVMLPTQTLLWHYRSRHEHLIAFSNAKIYQGNLITFPSSAEKSKDFGVEYIHVAGGTYDRGGRNGNRLEASRVAELVFEHLRTKPKRSLGIIAFGQNHQIAIQDAIDTKRRQSPGFEIFFKDDTEEPLFVKNLETVQGDERDTIILSIGYASDASGKTSMNFGPINRNGGERRLNVAVTRARYNLKLVGSIHPTDIHVEKTSGMGPKLLRQYIDFAMNGANAILGEISSSDELWFDSPFEVSVYDFLTKNGFDVATQVGCSGYRIDMAVRHPKYNGRFAIGIECDGAMYHSARTARERDRLRQTVLEDMGWKIYRIWSTDWIKDPHTEGERLLKAVRQAIEDFCEKPIVQTLSDMNADDLLETVTKTIDEIRDNKIETIKSKFMGFNAIDIPVSDFEQTMLRVLKNNFGLNKTEMFKETTLHGYGWKRQGSDIKKKLERAYNNLIRKDLIIEFENKILVKEEN